MSCPHPSASVDVLARLAALDDPLRRRLYDYVCDQDEPVGRDSAAGVVKISRSLAAYHLDKLADHGLLDVTFRRRSGRDGPGAGRPAKLYSRAAGDIAVSVPARNYELVARLLAEAADAGPPAALAAARRYGSRLAHADPARDRRLGPLLRECGYQPLEDADGTLRLRNCPFHAVARSHPELVCGLNLALVQGLLDGMGIAPERARLDPRENRCCVAIRNAD